MKEQFLQYLWNFSLFQNHALKTTQGNQLQIISPGKWNKDSGPDFSEALIVIDGIKWFGSVEIHTYASEWYAHGHQNDANYESCILHVVYENDSPIIRKNGSSIPVLELKNRFQPELYANFEMLLKNKSNIFCMPSWNSSLVKSRNEMLEQVLVERLQEKGNKVLDLLYQNQYDWDETVWQVFVMAFGTPLNPVPMHLLSRIVTSKMIARNSYSFTSVWSMLIGAAGLLGHPDFDEVNRVLSKEFQFLSAKFDPPLKAMDRSVWKYSKTRPANFPHHRITQLAMLMYAHPDFLSQIQHREVPEWLDCLQLNFQDRKGGDLLPASYRTELSNSMRELLIINGIIPILVAKSMYMNSGRYLVKATDLLHSLKFEHNRITELYRFLLPDAVSAAESQSLIHLYKNYCTMAQCLNCSIGQKIIRT